MGLGEEELAELESSVLLLKHRWACASLGSLLKGRVMLHSSGVSAVLGF